MEEIIAELRKQNEMLRAENALLKHELAQLKRMIFGAKSEKFIPTNTNQGSLFDSPAETAELKTITEVKKHERVTVETPGVQPPSRNVLPASLPRVEQIIEPEGKEDDWIKIGEDVSEMLELEEAKIKVIRTIRPKYKIPAQEETIIRIAELPSRPIEKGMPGPKLLANIIISKFVDHLPLYRQLQILKRLGVELSSSTVGGWIEKSATLLELLYEELKNEVLSQVYLQVDETPIQVQDKTKKGTTHRGYYWVYHSPEKKLALFDYREGRGREGPREMLKDFKGYLQTDGYVAYDEFSSRNDITLVGCMAHARRYFEKALENDKDRAEYFLSSIQQLYAVERSIHANEWTRDKIGIAREQASLPLLLEMKEWLEKNIASTTPSSPIGKAIRYSLERWDKMMIYIKNPKLNIDNNLVENSIRPVALGRKNYLFAGSHAAAQRAAMMYSFMLSCKLNDVDPKHWLEFVLNNIAETKKSALADLLPSNFKK